jgi:hypothetical protein
VTRSWLVRSRSRSVDSHQMRMVADALLASECEIARILRDAGEGQIAGKAGFCFWLTGLSSLEDERADWLPHWESDTRCKTWSSTTCCSCSLILTLRSIFFARHLTASFRTTIH